MKRFLLFVLLASYAHAASNGDILAKTREALGGAKLAAIQSLVIFGDYGHAVENESQITKGDLTLSFLLPDKYLREETMGLPNGIPGPVLIEGLNGEESWTDSRSQPNVIVRIQSADLTPEARRRGINTNLARYLLAFLASDRPGFPLTFTSAGEAEAHDGRADVIDVKGPDDFAARLFIDQKTHLPLLMTYRAQSSSRKMKIMDHGAATPTEAAAPIPMVDVQLRLGDYRKVNGVMLPHLLSWNSGGTLTDELEVKKVTINGKLDAAKFRK